MTRVAREHSPANLAAEILSQARVAIGGEPVSLDGFVRCTCIRDGKADSENEFFNNMKQLCEASIAMENPIMF